MSQKLIDHPIISERYFFPRPEPFESPHWVEVDGARLACHYSQVSADAPTVFHFHGNGEVVADYVDFLPQHFAAMGVNLFLAEYRGYGMSTGEPGLGRIIGDAEAVVASVGLPQEKMIFFGRSVGSIPAVHVAAQWPDAKGLIIESGIADVLQRINIRVLPEELGCTAEDLKNAVLLDMDQEKKMRRFQGPALVMHTVHDGIVDISHGRRLHAWAPSHDKEMLVFEDGDHNSIMARNHERYFTAVQRLVLK